jgi:FAD/FMN-containing dehydrogenase
MTETADTPKAPEATEAERAAARWSNWAGNVVAAPARRIAPAGETELARALRQTDTSAVRIAGSGHSFTPLCATEGLLVELDQLQGIVAIDAGRGRATVRAGTPLWALGAELHDAGLALENLGDIDRQTVAGAVATGTHGTGSRYGSLATQVTALRLLTVAGEALDLERAREPAAPSETTVDDDADRFSGAVVALGALGVVTRLTLRVVPAYRLHERMWKAPYEEADAELDERFAGHDHFEVFDFPQRERAALKSLDETDEEVDTTLPYDASRFEGERIDWSWRVFPSARNLRFVEMEYSVPLDAGRACWRALRTRLREHHPTVTWPLEIRRVAADALWLSPAYQRDAITISVHQGAGLPYRELFADAESILRDHGGRPHWGKLHDLGHRELAELYPRWEDFARLRRELDPTGRLLNEHLRRLFGAP